MNIRFKTVVVSDLHLGMKSSKAKEVVRFIKNHPAEKIILNGDIIDGWQLKKSGSWKKKHTRFFKLLLKMLSKEKTQVIYLRGNHDDFLDEVLPLEIGNFSIRRDYIHESFGKRYYVVHGDIFDSITTNLKWLAKLGDVGYTFLLWINGLYNNYRRRKGLPYYSLSQQVKLKVKQAVSFISEFENELVEVARIKKCQGVITGHIHHPANKTINGIHYLNSGDWVESMTALIEDFAGEWKIVYYDEWAKEREAQNIIETNTDNSSENAKLLHLEANGK